MTMKNERQLSSVAQMPEKKGFICANGAQFFALKKQFLSKEVLINSPEGKLEVMVLLDDRRDIVALQTIESGFKGYFIAMEYYGSVKEITLKTPNAEHCNHRKYKKQGWYYDNKKGKVVLL